MIIALASALRCTVAPKGWWPFVLAWAVLYAPIYSELWQTVWQAEEYSFAPLVGLISAWLLWRNRAGLPASATVSPIDQVGGALLFAVGLGVYWLGRSQGVPVLEVGSQVLVLASWLWLSRGRRALAVHSFALFFLCFMVPLPGYWVMQLTASLKSGIAQAAVELLYQAGLPVAQNGALIAVGRYQVLVADACSGLYSMISLSALGLLYVHLLGERSTWQRMLLLGSVLPIAFLINLLRVLALIVSIYGMGEGVQRWLHDWSSPMAFLLALALLFVLDWGLDRVPAHAGVRHA